GESVISGNVGVSPGSAVVGFPPGTVTPPASIFTEAAAAGPQLALTAAYIVAAGAISTVVPTELGGTSPVPGVYSTNDGTLGITGDLTLDAENDPDAEWIFQASTLLDTAFESRVLLINGASPCNVFWVVDTATLGVGSTMVGTVMALTTITTEDDALVTGRLLARNGEVTLINTTINTPPACIEASSFSQAGGVPYPVLPDTGLELPWVAWSLSFAAILAGAAGVVLATTRRRAARS
ncbi:MAG: DUF3494 domain-containing protein, partial [Salinibacterium sp.]|nr:DUF3494 domain-containing protein [Salinibacterium sp.]